MVTKGQLTISFERIEDKPAIRFHTQQPEGALLTYGDVAVLLAELTVELQKQMHEG